MTEPREIVSEILALFQSRGHRQYGEDVTEMQHGLQCATLAADAGEDAEVTAACLLHDFGHLLHDLGEDVAERGVDARHEHIGANRLAAWFGEAVVAPIRMHAAAKRYLCAKESGYFEGLSEASRRSLALQGGPMTDEELAAFEQHPQFERAIRVRRYDDRGKVPGFPTPEIEAFRPLLESLVLASLAGLRVGRLDGLTFMVLLGLGLYLPYVAVHTTVFERLIAMTRDRGNIGYLKYVVDALGYLGYVVVMLGKNWLRPEGAFLPFFMSLCSTVVALATVAFLADGITPGCLYDLTLRGASNDQMVIFAPLAQLTLTRFLAVGRSPAEAVGVVASKLGVVGRLQARVLDSAGNPVTTATLGIPWGWVRFRPLKGR